MWLDMAKQRVRKMNAQEVGERRIGAIEVHPGGIGRKQPVLSGPSRDIVVSGELVHYFLPPVRSALSCRL
jgi:hypothetical protein